jgi:hypothetical protein
MGREIVILEEDYWIWKAILPADGWFMVQIYDDPFDIFSDDEEPFYYSEPERLIGWAQVNVTTGSDGGEGGHWDSLVGITRNMAFEGDMHDPPGLCVWPNSDLTEISYFHESDNLDKLKDAWISRSIHLAKIAGNPLSIEEAKQRREKRVNQPSQSPEPPE